MQKATKKQRFELEEAPEGIHVVLTFVNSDQYEGIYKGMDDDNIILESLSGDNRIGLPFNRLFHYHEIQDE